MTPRHYALLLAALPLLAAGCSSGGSHAASVRQTPQQQINNGGTFDARGKTTVDVTATNFEFSPSTIIATPGQQLTLVVRNTSDIPHNITATGTSTDLAPGSTHRVTLTVPASGELTFVCSFHASSGMAGQIGPAAGSAPAASSSPTSGGGYHYGGY